MMLPREGQHLFLYMSEKYDIISIGAHPDDVEVGTGGVLIKMAKYGYRTGLIYLTQGEMGTGGDPEIRAHEAVKAAGIMGADLLETFDWGDTRLIDEPQYRYRLAELLRKYRPDIVLAPWMSGGHGKRQSHPDHLAAGQIVTNSIYYATFKKLPIEGEIHHVKGLYHYFLPPEKEPTFVVDITDQFELWMDTLKAHESQFMNPEKSRDYLWSLETMARSYGQLVGVKYGQGFRIGEPLKIMDPFCLVKSRGDSPTCLFKPDTENGRKS
jgi:N-acetylglucosamine malate deacetylase 1